MSLHWSTDPLLYDEQSTSYNDWVTANHLIDKGEVGKVINKNHFFANIYGIMVRKIDFVRTSTRDRIIARFPFLVIEDEQCEIIQNQILIISENVRDYFYKSINKSILQWKEIILSYLQKGSLPYPIFRCCFELLPELNKPYTKPSLRFTSARGEAFTFPTKLTTKLAYLCGVCNGDGNLRDYWIIIVDETKEHIKGIQSILDELFNKKGKIMKVSGAWAIKLNLLWSVRLLNFLTEQSIDQPKYDALKEPLIFKHFKGDFRIDYWRGMMDSDGSYSKYAINLTTASEQLKNDFSQFLSDNSIGHNYSVITYPNSQVENYIVYLLANSHLDFCKLIGSNHPKKKNDLEVLLSRKEKQRFSGKIIKLKKELLLPNGYFNFYFTPRLQIYIGEYLNKIRNCSISDFSLKIQIPKSTLLNYEKNKQAIAISKIISLHQNLSIDFDINQFIQENSITHFNLSKSSLRLPLYPEEKFLEFIQPMRVKRGYVNLVKTSKQVKKQIKDEICVYFDLPPINTNQIWNAVLTYFIATFFIIQK